jgi:hypothetical protein
MDGVRLEQFHCPCAAECGERRRFRLDRDDRADEFCRRTDAG